MLIVWNVFQAKYGKGGELVALFKEVNDLWPEELNVRILTDASGPFFTVVTEAEVENFAEWEKYQETIYSHPDFSEGFARMEPLVDTGYREFLNVE